LTTNPIFSKENKNSVKACGNGAFENFPKHYITTFQNQWSF
jgi:hypothetical protein